MEPITIININYLIVNCRFINALYKHREDIEARCVYLCKLHSLPAGSICPLFACDNKSNMLQFAAHDVTAQYICDNYKHLVNDSICFRCPRIEIANGICSYLMLFKHCNFFDFDNIRPYEFYTLNNIVVFRMLFFTEEK